MIVRSGGRDIEVLQPASSTMSWPAAWPHSAVPPSELMSGGGLRASRAHLEQSVGVPALLGTLLRIGQLCGLVPLKTYQGSQLDREPAVGTWQYELLHDNPSPDVGPSAFYSDVAFTLAGLGACPIRKYKSRGRVVALEALDPSKVTPVRKGGTILFEDRTDGKMIERDKRDIIYVRGVALPGQITGLAPITAARLGIINGLRRQLFEAMYYENSAEARVVLAFPERLNRAEAEEWVDLWEGDHQGSGGWHRTAAIGGGATVTHLPVSMEDAQFVEANAMTGAEIGGIYGVPRPFLNLGDNSPTDADWKFLVTAGLGWIFTTIAQSLTRDRDLFPLELDPSRRMHAEHVVDALTRPDIKTRFEAYKAARQAGWMTSNEIRALENMQPHPDGNMLQVIPVGGGEPRDQASALLVLQALATIGSPEQRAILDQVIARATDDGTGDET